jgi:hypothetical protein
MTTPLVNLLQSLVGVVLSIISIGVSVGAPLLTLGNSYDLHLFPRNDAIHYESSVTHFVSQITHCLALAFFVTAFIVLVALSSTFAHLSGRTQKAAATTVAVLVTSGFISHIIALSTLAKVASDWKRHFEHLPIPLPDIRVSARAGLYAELVAVLLNGSVTVLAWLALRKIAVQSYVSLP